MGLWRVTTGVALVAVVTTATVASAGVLDRGFGKDGIVTARYRGPAHSTGSALTIDSDQKIVVAGHADSHVGIARRLSNGKSDVEFGFKRSEAFLFGRTAAGRVADVEVQAGGDEGVVVAFDITQSPSGADIGLFGLRSDGGVDSGFDGGLVPLDLGPSASVADIAVDALGQHRSPATCKPAIRAMLSPCALIARGALTPPTAQAGSRSSLGPEISESRILLSAGARWC